MELINKFVIGLELIIALSIGADISSAKSKNQENKQTKKVEIVKQDRYSSCSDCEDIYAFSCTQKICDEISKNIGENCAFYKRRNHLPNCADEFWGPDRSIYPWPKYK